MVSSCCGPMIPIDSSKCYKPQKSISKVFTIYKFENDFIKKRPFIERLNELMRQGYAINIKPLEKTGEADCFTHIIEVDNEIYKVIGKFK